MRFVTLAVALLPLPGLAHTCIGGLPREGQVVDEQDCGGAEWAGEVRLDQVEDALEVVLHVDGLETMLLAFPFEPAGAGVRLSPIPLLSWMACAKPSPSDTFSCPSPYVELSEGEYVVHESEPLGYEGWEISVEANVVMLRPPSEDCSVRIVYR